MAWKYLWQERAEQLGEARGEARGDARGLEALKKMVCDLLEARFGPLDDGTRQKVQAASQDELQRWCLAVVSARTIDEVF